MPIFSLQTLPVLLVGRKNILSPDAWHPSYTTDKIIGVGLVGCSSPMYILNKIPKLGKYL